jgi:uncharacterized membrane protein YbhN (UPF0104 family)
MKIASVIIRVGVSAGILVVVFNAVDSAETWAALGSVGSGVLLAATVLFLAQTPILAWRWRRIVQLLDSNLTYSEAVRFSLIGRLYNQIMPASVGGDAVRAWYGARSGLTATISAHSVLIERFTGLLSLLALTSVAATFLWFRVDVSFAWPGEYVAIAVGIMIMAGAVVALASTRLRHWPVARHVFDLWDNTRIVLRDGRAFALLSLSAVASNILAIGVAMVIGGGLGLQLDVWVYAVVVPIAILMTIVPMSIGGWGVREGTIVFLLHLFGVPTPTALALSLLFGVTLLFASIAGGGVGYFLRPRASD